MLHSLEQKGKVELYYELSKPKSAIKYKKMISLKAESPEERKLLEIYVETIRKKSPKEALLLELLLKEKRELPSEEINLRISRSSPILDRLESKGMLRSFYKEKLREPLWGMSLEPGGDFSLTAEQKDVLEKLEKGLDQGRYHPFCFTG